MNPLEKEIIGKQMAVTLSELNKHFVKNNSITKKEFMDLQFKCWQGIKEEVCKKFSDKPKKTKEGK